MSEQPQPLGFDKIGDQYNTQYGMPQSAAAPPTTQYAAPAPPPPSYHQVRNQFSLLYFWVFLFLSDSLQIKKSNFVIYYWKINVNVKCFFFSFVLKGYNYRYVVLYNKQDIKSKMIVNFWAPLLCHSMH